MGENRTHTKGKFVFIVLFAITHLSRKSESSSFKYMLLFLFDVYCHTQLNCKLKNAALYALLS